MYAAYKRRMFSKLVHECSEERRTLLAGTFADNLPPLTDWPVTEMCLCLGDHLDYNNRCSLVYFLIVNQCPPILIVKWAKAQAGWLKHKESALHMAGLIASWRDGTFETTTFRTAANVCATTPENRDHGPDHALGKTAKDFYVQETVFTPNFACEEVARPARDKDGNSLGFWIPAGRDFWDDAIKELEEYALTLPMKPKSF